MDMTSVFAEIVKTAPQEDGSLLVYGKATGSDLDFDQQRCDPAWLKRAMPDWFTIGNIRSQHDPKQAVGKAVEHEVKDDGHWIKANIVDPIAVTKTKAGVFTGFSIGIAGPRIAKSVDAPGGIINDGKIVEVSLVDRPCLPTATLTVCKAAEPGMEISAGAYDEERGLVKVEELVEKTENAPESESAAKPSPLDMPGAKKPSDKLNKATDVDHTDEPAPGQKCAVCGEDGHVHCTPADTVEDAQKTAEGSDGGNVEFDKDAALELVKTTLAKADGDMPAEYADEQSDAQNAMAAISIISKLIVSEASEMVDNPAEDCDIQILLSAVSALRCFIGREQQQSLGANDTDDAMSLAAEPDMEKAKYSAEQLRQMLKDGKAFRNANGEPSYPIGDKEDLSNAIHAVGRGSGDHNSIRAYIKRRASALGASDMIPDNWSSSGSNKSADVETHVYVDGEEIEPATGEKAAEPASESTEDLDKSTEPEVAKAATVTEDADPDALVKALSVALEKADSPIRKSLEAIVEASTKPTAEAVSELTNRLDKVESMAIPGGPALRRTEVERKEARKSDLLTEAARFKALARNAEDLDLRRGYATKAAQLEAEIKALAA